MFKPDPLFIALRRLDLCDHHIDGIDIGGSANLGHHDQIQPFARLFDHINDIAVHVMGIQPVDSDRHGFGAPVHFVQRLDDILAGLRFFIGRNGILKVEENHVSCRFRCLFKHLRLTARYGEFGTIEPGRGLFDDVKAHGIGPLTGKLRHSRRESRPGVKQQYCATEAMRDPMEPSARTAGAMHSRTQSPARGW